MPWLHAMTQNSDDLDYLELHSEAGRVLQAESAEQQHFCFGEGVS